MKVSSVGLAIPLVYFGEFWFSCNHNMISYISLFKKTKSRFVLHWLDSGANFSQSMK